MAKKTTERSVELGTRKQFRDLSVSNRELIELNLKRRFDFRINPELIYPWRRRCTVNVLLVTDGGLDFGEGDFGLSTVVRVLKNARLAACASTLP